jgi:hypothetical protein
VILKDGIVKSLRAKIDKARVSQPWNTHFVMSAEPRASLPQSLSDPRVRTLCVVKADVSQTSRIVKNRHWYNFSPKFELTVLDLKVLPGSADLKLEVWNDGRRLSRDHDTIEVEWEKKLGNPRLTDASLPLTEELDAVSPSRMQPRSGSAMGIYGRRIEQPQQHMHRSSYG